MRTRQFVIDGLGHLSTLVIDEAAGVAVVIDPRRDVDVYLAAASADNVRITHVVETHLHNDYVSGGRELASLTGATHVIGAGAALGYEHRPIRHGDEFETGQLRFRALETPGHTPEHVAYAMADTSRAEEPVALFSGGSLLVGAVGRTDLLGAENAVPYAHAQFRSLHEVVLAHEDYVAVHPTHGAGSLCATGISSTPTTTIGFERRHNELLQPAEADEFARILLRGQPAFPKYFARMRPTNQAGPAPIGTVPGPRPMQLPAVLAAVARGALIVDTRQPTAHAVAHVPGSLSIPAGSSFGTWLGWITEPDRPVVLVLDRAEDWDDLVRQSLRIGYDSVAGYLHGGFASWIEAGQPIESSGRLTVDELAARLSRGGPEAPFVVDVRQETEYAAGHVPGAAHVFAGALGDRLDELPRDHPIAAMCASGYRSSVAASLLRAAGFSDVSWVADGLPAWEARGHPVERGTLVGGRSSS